MELQQIKNLLVKHLQTGPLPDEEGEQLLAAMEQLIHDNQFETLTGIQYQLQGVNKTLSALEAEKLYWEIAMYYGGHEDDHHHHDHDDDHEDHDDEHPAKQNWLQRWSWLLILLAAMIIALKYWLGLGLHDAH